MLEAFIVDQLKKTEEEKWIDLERPILQLPVETEEPPMPENKEEGTWTIRF